MSIVKAELLWTRHCPLDCSYCRMADGRRNKVQLEKWLDGIDNLVSLDCGFMAIYGAEPLSDLKCLPHVVEYAEARGIACSVITSGVARDVPCKLKYLYDCGLRSLTVSHDGKPLPGASKRKTKAGQVALGLFEKFGPVRDLAITATLTRENFRDLPGLVKLATANGHWVFWDVVHYDRGQEGSKCASREDVESLLFRPEDFADLRAVLEEFKSMKDSGRHVHHSDVYLAAIQEQNFRLLRQYDWNCADHDCFPAWLTIDCDGTVFPCDDFQPRWGGRGDVKVWEIARRWDEWVETWRPVVKSRCPGCAWNTHIDAVAIKEGRHRFDDYVHGKHKGWRGHVEPRRK